MKQFREMSSARYLATAGSGFAPRTPRRQDRQGRQDEVNRGKACRLFHLLPQNRFFFLADLASWRLGALCAVVAVLFAIASARADDAGITVAGVGTVKGQPTVVEIGSSVSGEGELANDASVKYRDAKKRAVAALDALKNPDISVESKGFAVNQATDPAAQQRMMQGMGADPNAKSKVQVTEDLKVLLKNADKLEPEKLMETILKIIDTSRDSGLSIGPGAMNYYQMQMAAQNGQSMSMISFKIPDPSDLREKAYKLAIDDAKAKANRLAELSGVKLGHIVSVQDQDAGKNDPNMYNYWYQMAQSNKNQGDASLSSNVFGEIALSVHLVVQFEIEK
jgi:uncharacterized protein YggE